MAKLKRLLTPRFWKVPKKVTKWVVAPRAGPHSKFESIPLQIILRDILKLVERGKEARLIIKKGEILVDGKKRKDHAYPAGLFDVITIPKLKQFYRIVPYEKGLKLITVSEEESKLKICRIDNKTIVKKGKLQLNLHDGKNILVDKNEYKTGDSVLIQLPEKKIIEHLKLEKGNVGIVTKGVDAGKIGEIKKVLEGKVREPSKIICDLEGKEETVLKDRFFVVGKDKPLITVSE